MGRWAIVLGRLSWEDGAPGQRTLATMTVDAMGGMGSQKLNAGKSVRAALKPRIAQTTKCASVQHSSLQMHGAIYTKSRNARTLWTPPMSTCSSPRKGTRGGGDDLPRQVRISKAN